MNFETNREYKANLNIEQKEIEPSLFQIILHNDGFTPMEFVIGILEKYFYMDRAVAAAVMIEAHTKGKALCGKFAKDFAEAKISQVIDYARTHEHPLICSMEVAV